MTTQARIYPGDGDPRHGTLNGYNHLTCRCDDCRTAPRQYQRGRRRADAQRRYAPTTVRLPGVELPPADGACLLRAPAPTPAVFPPAGVGVTPGGGS